MPKLYTYQEIADHNSENDLWLIINGKVYDCTKFAEEHPGGDEVLIDLAGQDATEPFADIGHSDDAVKMLEDLYVGDLDKDSEPVAGASDDRPSTTGGGEGNGALWLAFIVFFLAAVYYNYHHSKWT
ncbi:AaceriAFL223Wp [[Ashbya] aceris (nom. inval.)]|nr:AaceriAFL223Wp [[Ashbya] aceris (nom. inval.)]